MELAIEAKKRRTSPRSAFQNDPQVCRALRQGDIALIHSAPTGERKTLFPPSSLLREKQSNDPK
jgi:hypothetical protein